VVRISATVEPSSADRDLETRIRGSLEGRFFASLRRLDVTALDGTVTLQGQVASFYEKQLALSACRQVDGVRSLIDCVGVVG
jgi:osmotically-inducible protein OsmY